MRGHMPWIKPLIIIGFIFVIGYIFVDVWDNVSHNCKPTGEQRLTNTVDGVAVVDKLVCDGGRVKWTRSYN